MNIALIGYGKMGKEVEKISIARGHKVIHRLNSKELESITDEELKKAEIAIEFTSPESAKRNFYRCFSLGIPLVTGSTGWYNDLDNVLNKCSELNASFFYSSNFSLGVNIFFRLNEQLARIMKNYPQYNVSIEEAHHVHKKDAPSGTAITIAEGIMREKKEIKKYSIDSDNEKDILSIKVIREDEIPGTHTVYYRSEADELHICHQANNRSGFALGATLAAEFLIGKKGVYTMKDLLSLE